MVWSRQVGKKSGAMGYPGLENHMDKRMEHEMVAGSQRGLQEACRSCTLGTRE